ncbi:MAG: dehydrogenase, partial [Eggerthellaceae bacterium]
MAYSGGWGRDLLPEQEPKRLGLDRYRLLQMGFKQSSPDVLIETLETGEPYEIHGAHFQTTNGIACMGAAPRRVYNAFNKCDFIMSVDLFMTPTIMALADLVMPAATFPERNGIRV